MLRTQPAGYRETPWVSDVMTTRSELSRGLTSLLVMALVLAPTAWGQTGIGLDLAINSKHVWRGQTYRNGWVVQPEVFVFQTWQRTTLTGGLWLHVEPFGPGSDNDVGYGRAFGGEVNTWLDFGYRTGPVVLNSGLVGMYLRVGDAAGPASDRVRSHELYVRAILARSRLTPTVSVSYDLDAVGGAYVDLGLQYRLPVWTQVVVPVGSAFVRASAALAMWQRSHGDGTLRGGRYFADNGLTYVTFSVWLPVGPFAVGPTSNSLALAAKVQINADPYLEDVSGAVDASRRAKIWMGLTWTLLGPRCRASRRVCPVGSLP
jgi:hypothetical protein